MRHFLWFVLLAPSLIWGFDDSPRCLREVEINYLDHRYLQEAFDMYRIFQSQWTQILTTLSQRVPNIPGMVRDRARKMSPDPFEHPFDGEKVKSIILDVEFEVLQEVLITNYVTDLNAINGIFNYVRSRRENYLDACLIKSFKKPTTFQSK